MRAFLRTALLLTCLFAHQLNAELTDKQKVVRDYQNLYREMGLFYQKVSREKEPKTYEELKWDALIAWLKAPAFSSPMADIDHILMHYRTHEDSLPKTFAPVQKRLQTYRDTLANVRYGKSSPNMVFLLHKNFLAPEFAQKIEEDSDVNRMILGAHVTGKAKFDGKMELRLVPSEDNAKMVVITRGKVLSNDSGSKQKVVTKSHSLTDVIISKPAVFDESGFHLLPAKAKCRTSIEYDSIDANYVLGIIRRFAVSQANGMKPKMETEASKQTKKEMEERADKYELPEIAKQLIDLQMVQIPEIQKAMGLAPMWTHFQTNDTFLNQSYLIPDKLRKDPISPIPKSEKPMDVEIAMHDSSWNGWAQFSLGGTTMIDGDFAYVQKLLLGITDPEYRIGSHMERWSVTFDTERPIVFHFEKNQMVLELKATSWKIGKKEIADRTEISVAYGISVGKNGPEFTRVGDPKVQTSNKELKEFVTAKVQGFFLKTMTLDGLVPPAGGQFEKLLKLKTEEFRSQDGWILFGWLSN